jgi:hypothetical protein
VDVNENNPARQYLLNSRMTLSLNLMGESQRVNVVVKAELDSEYRLQTFQMVFSARAYTVAISGQRGTTDGFDVEIRTGGTTQRMALAVPDEAVLYSPMVEMSLKALRPGKQVRLRAFNPLSLGTDDITVRGLRRETLTQGGRSEEALVVAADYQGMETLTWLDADGRILRQETPLGWTLEACTPQEAVAALLRPAGGGARDVLAALAVPIEGPSVTDPRTRRDLRLRLKGVALPREGLESPRQTVHSMTGTVAELTARAEVLPESGAPSLAQPVAGELTLYLAASPALQANDPELAAAATNMVRGAADRLAAALAIYEWVNRHVEKRPTASYPSALDVWRHREGDCNEHTYLFVALARAAGIPARIRVGIVFNDGAFYYHAWPAVHVGRWVDMDPTLGQPAVDATHVSLLEGELAEQLRLMAVIGRLRVEVVPEPPPAAPPARTGRG